MKPGTKDIINLEEACTLGGLFRERVRRRPDDIAYRHYDTSAKRWRDINWRESGKRVAQMQAALAKEKLQPGDRVAIMLRNCPQWVQFEQAAIGMGLIVVPLYTNDRAENIAYVLQDAGVRLLLIEGHEQLSVLQPIASQIDGLVRLLSLEQCQQYNRFPRLKSLSHWLEDIDRNIDETNLQAMDNDKDALATIVYTSGTTGRPKGVMLSHYNILFNCFAATKCHELYREDVFLSFLPLSHMLERTVGYYIPMMIGATVAFARSVQDLPEDLLSIRPTILVSVPRIYERVYNKIMLQLESKSDFARNLFMNAVEAGWRRFKNPADTTWKWPIYKRLVANKVMAKLGGRLRLAICGGAPLSETVAKLFVGLGLNLIHGYGLTETSPIITANRMQTNNPASVGEPFDGVEVKIGDDDELLTRSPSVMLGYWNNDEATRAMIDDEGWLHTGDKARIENGMVYITGRIKEILVMSNGEKVAPSDVELAVTMDPLIDQAMVIGEGKPYLSALVVLNQDEWPATARQLGMAADDLEALNTDRVKEFILQRMDQQMDAFPGYAHIKSVQVLMEPWTVENGLITPTLKTRRNKVLEHYQLVIDAMYSGH
jgi:long-chain acyl-CoA synthetase